jgi:hypothetical protein
LANNQYACYGPTIVEMFRDLWRRRLKTEDPKQGNAGTLFRMWLGGDGEHYGT